jgi:ABC-type antimicrobial peptide transport system permease subunit
MSSSVLPKKSGGVLFVPVWRFCPRIILSLGGSNLGRNVLGRIVQGCFARVLC